MAGAKAVARSPESIPTGVHIASISVRVGETAYCHGLAPLEPGQKPNKRTPEGFTGWAPTHFAIEVDITHGVIGEMVPREIRDAVQAEFWSGLKAMGLRPEDQALSSGQATAITCAGGLDNNVGYVTMLAMFPKKGAPKDFLDKLHHAAGAIRMSTNGYKGRINNAYRAQHG